MVLDIIFLAVIIIFIISGAVRAPKVLPWNPIFAVTI